MAIATLFLRNGTGIAIISITTRLFVMTALVPKLFTAAAFFCLAAGSFADTASVFLGWDSSAEEVAGYKVYWGTTSGVYNRQNDAHHQTTPEKPHQTDADRY